MCEIAFSYGIKRRTQLYFNLHGTSSLYMYILNVDISLLYKFIELSVTQYLSCMGGSFSFY